MFFAKKFLLSICMMGLISMACAQTSPFKVSCQGDSGIKLDDCTTAIANFDGKLTDVGFNTQGDWREFGSCRVYIRKKVAASNKSTINRGYFINFVKAALEGCSGGTGAAENSDYYVSIISK
ncbi:expressed protein [Phakopsora pachyrhizi]|uniref:Expressed protein n=1 Tax=Phakopsora pachyrhizi TaxID=170000 RepID=A0A0S1MIC6_PHAPC|nr:expressed protein [Phakopsora pachyrhizi]